MSTCTKCGRKRTPEDVPYDPFQVIMKGKVGWYSGPDGEYCPQDMVAMLTLSNKGFTYTVDTEGLIIVIDPEEPS